MTITDRRFGVAEGLAVKAPCVAATTADITLSGLQTIDGVSLAGDDRVIVKNQTDGTENGIYIASSSAWERAPDFDGSRDVVTGTMVFVASGTTQASSIFVLTTSSPVIGTSSLAFTSLSVLLAAAPQDAVYITGATNAALSAERVLTDNSDITWDQATAGQLKATITNDAVTYAKMQNVSASPRVLGRYSSGAGNVEEIFAGTGIDIGSTGTISAALPRGYIDGCIVANNATDATNDIDFAAGVCRDSTNAQNITCAAMTKQLDAAWSAGTGNGMRSSSALANTTWHLFAIVKADGTQDYLAHDGVDPTAVLPTDYVRWRMIGSIIRASGAILAFLQNGDFFQLTTPILDVSNATPGTSANTATLTVPLGLKLPALINIGMNIGYLYVSSLDVSDQAPNTAFTAAPIPTLSDGASAGSGQATILTNTSAQIRYRCSANNLTAISTHGWRHPRGKDA